jgi:hypothetical protein
MVGHRTNSRPTMTLVPVTRFVNHALPPAYCELGAGQAGPVTHLGVIVG